MSRSPIENPYATPYHSGQPNQYGQGFRPGQSSSPSLPAFCIAMFVISLVFCVVRFFLVAMGVVGLINAEAAGLQGAMFYSGIFEVLTGIGIVVFGIIGNTLMLFKKPIGKWFGWLTVASVIGSIFVSVAQLIIQVQTLSNELSPPFLIGLLGVGAAVMMIRIGILVAYIFAIKKFSQIVK